MEYDISKDDVITWIELKDLIDSYLDSLKIYNDTYKTETDNCIWEKGFNKVNNLSISIQTLLSKLSDYGFNDLNKFVKLLSVFQVNKNIVNDLNKICDDLIDNLFDFIPTLNNFLNDLIKDSKYDIVRNGELPESKYVLKLYNKLNILINKITEIIHLIHDLIKLIN